MATLKIDSPQIFNKSVKAVLRFEDEKGKAYDGTEYDTTIAEVCKMALYPGDFGYKECRVTKYENGTYYCTVVE